MKQRARFVYCPNKKYIWRTLVPFDYSAGDADRSLIGNFITNTFSPDHIINAFGHYEDGVFGFNSYLRKTEDSDTKIKVINPFTDPGSNTVGMVGHQSITFDKRSKVIKEIRKSNTRLGDMTPLLPYKVEFSGQCKRALLVRSLICNLQKDGKMQEEFLTVDSEINFIGESEKRDAILRNKELIKKQRENMKMEISDKEIKVKDLGKGFYSIKLDRTNGKFVKFGSNENEIIEKGECKQ